MNEPEDPGLAGNVAVNLDRASLTATMLEADRSGPPTQRKVSKFFAKGAASRAPKMKDHLDSMDLRNSHENCYTTNCGLPPTTELRSERWFVVAITRDWQNRPRDEIMLKAKLLPIAFLLAMAAPGAYASVLSIGDPLPGHGDADETITLLVNAPFSITSLGQFAPGTGDVIDTTQLNDPAHQLSNIDCPVIEQDRPTCAFTFANHLPWNTDVFLYRYFTGVPGTAEEGFLSDLFVIQGYGGQNPDYIWFRSSDALTGDILLDGPTLLAGSTATRTNLGTVAENGDWQLAFDTGVDQYYIASAPEPATLALLGLGLAGLGFSRRKQ